MRLSVLAMGRRERKRSARLKAAGGEVELAADGGTRVPSDVLLGISAPISISCVGKGVRACKSMCWAGIPHCALSLLSNMGFLLFTAPLPSPRLWVKTFRQTLRGGISQFFFRDESFPPVRCGWVWKDVQEAKGIQVFQAKSVAAESFGEKRCEV